jgi:type I restriction enzyme S subunit
MELKQGYKQTEVGVIPEDWKIEILNDLTTRIGDGIHSTPKYSNNGEYYFVNGNNLVNGKIIVSNDTKKVSNEEYHYHKRELNDSTILISINGTIGNIALYGNENILIGKSAAYLNLNNKIKKLFLYQVLQSKFINRYFENELTGSTIKNLGLGVIRNTPIPLPTLPEQTAIANALSDMDALISQTEKLIEKKKAIKQGAMQELLKPKEGWVTKTLGEIGVISGAGVDKKINANENAVRLLNYMDVYKRDFIYSNELNHWVTAPANKLANCSVKQGDVFFTPSSETRTDIGLAAVAMEDISNAVYSYHVMRFRLLLDWDIKFKVYIFQTKHFLDQTEKMCEGGGKRYVLTMPKFRALLITYPESIIEQQEISWKLWDMDQELKLLSTKLTKLKQQKQGMMQALLTGKIRLES